MASIYLRGKTYWVSYYVTGVKIQHSLKTKDEKIAKYKKSEIESRILSGDFQVTDLRVIQEKINSSPWIESRWSRMNDREKQAIIFTIFEGKCFYCSKELSLPVNIERRVARERRMVMDHLVPFSAGGSDLPGNLLASCHDCNQKKGDREYKKFRENAGIRLTNQDLLRPVETSGKVEFIDGRRHEI